MDEVTSSPKELSGEKIISIAEKENKSNLQNRCNLLIGVIEIIMSQRNTGKEPPVLIREQKKGLRGLSSPILGA